MRLPRVRLGVVPIGEVRVPKGISRLKSLQTLEGIYTGASISKELGVSQMILKASRILHAT